MHKKMLQNLMGYHRAKAANLRNIAASLAGTRAEEIYQGQANDHDLVADKMWARLKALEKKGGTVE